MGQSARVRAPAASVEVSDRLDERDFFAERNGLTFAGVHLLVDMWGASRLDEPQLIEDALKAAAREAGATVLHAHFHRFSPSGGVTGVVVLAASHISIHTWPSRGYAAIDVFMCGSSDPRLALPVLRRAFKPSCVTVSDQKRGLKASAP